MNPTLSAVKYGSVTRHAVHLGVLAGIEVNGHAAPGTEEVGVGVIAADHERLRLGITDAATELRRGSFLDLVVHIHEVGGSGHGLGFRFDLLYVRQSLEALLGAIQRHVRQPASLELAHLAAQYFVVDLGDTIEGDVPHVDAITRIDEERQ